MKTINELCDIVRQTAYDLHIYHGNGRLANLMPFVSAFFAFFRG